MRHTPQHLPVAIGWYFMAFKKYFVMKGRASRAEYWNFVLFNLIASILFYSLDPMLGLNNSLRSAGVLSSLYSLVVFIPSITLGVRRLHDIGRSGWWLVAFMLSVLIFVVALLAVAAVILIGQAEPSFNLYSFLGFSALLSFVMAITMLVFALLDSQPGTNRFGPNPKGIS